MQSKKTKKQKQNIIHEKIIRRDFLIMKCY